jgi:hypothetical protein
VPLWGGFLNSGSGLFVLKRWAYLLDRVLEWGWRGFVSLWDDLLRRVVVMLGVHVLKARGLIGRKG